MSIGEKIQILRKNRSISQEHLATELEVSRQAISKWENDESLPSIDKIVLLSQFFGVTTDYLLCDDSSNVEDEEVHVHENHNGLPQLNSVVEMIKKKGNIVGYVISGYGLLAFMLSRGAHFMFRRMMLPNNFGLTLADLPSKAKMALYVANVLSVITVLIIVVGLVLAYYLKQKAKKADE